jgi:hypothetical protein
MSIYNYNYNNKWLQHVSGMERSRLVQAVVKYQPPGKRNTGHTLKGLLGCYIETRMGNKE